MQCVFARPFEKLGDSLAVWGVHHGFWSASVVVGTRKAWKHVNVDRALRRKAIVSKYTVLEILERGGGRDETIVSSLT